MATIWTLACIAFRPEALDVHVYCQALYWSHETSEINSKQSLLFLSVFFYAVSNIGLEPTYSVDTIKHTVHLAFQTFFFLIYSIFNRDFFEITVENSTLNRDSTFNRTIYRVDTTYLSGGFSARQAQREVVKNFIFYFYHFPLTLSG